MWFNNCDEYARALIDDFATTILADVHIHDKNACISDATIQKMFLSSHFTAIFNVLAIDECLPGMSMLVYHYEYKKILCTGQYSSMFANMFIDEYIRLPESEKIVLPYCDVLFDCYIRSNYYANGTQISLPLYGNGSIGYELLSTLFSSEPIYHLTSRNMIIIRLRKTDSVHCRDNILRDFWQLVVNGQI